MERERDVAVRTAARGTARAAVECGRDAASVEEEDRLPACLREPSELGEERRRERVTGLAAQVDHADGRHRRGDAAAELEPLERVPGLRPRGRRAEDRDGALERRSLRGHGARVVARIRLLLVRRVVLLVDADHAERRERREHGGPRSDHHGGLAGDNPLALVPPLRLREPGVEKSDPVAEARAEAAERLRRRARSPARGRSRRGRGERASQARM
jgi:hypothetical protein